MAWAANLGICRDQESIGAAALQRHDLRIHGRIGGFVGLGGDDHLGRLVAQPLAQADQVVLAEIVVLIEHGDLGVRYVLEDVAGINARLDLVAGLPAHGPGKLFGIVPLVGAGGDEHLRHFVVVQIAADCAVGRRAERVEQRQHVVFLDQLAHHFDGLRRAIAVVAADEVDLAAVDAALLIDHVEVGGLRLADGAVGRSRAAIGHSVAELDLGVAGAGSVLARGQR